jgi:hypothetical protein
MRSGRLVEGARTVHRRPDSRHLYFPRANRVLGPFNAFRPGADSSDVSALRGAGLPSLGMTYPTRSANRIASYGACTLMSLSKYTYTSRPDARHVPIFRAHASSSVSVYPLA